MNRTVMRVLTTTGATAGALALLAGTAVAHECVNPNKKPLAGAQIVFSDDGVWMTKGLEKRVEKGLVDAETGEGFHGLIGFDEDGMTGTTWQVTPTGSIPHQAMDNGAECNGIISFDAWMSCMGE
jgi:hypothetical protein